MEPGWPEFVDSPSLNFAAGGRPAQSRELHLTLLPEPA